MLKFKMLEVKESLIKQANRGVFVKRAFKSGEKVCFYKGEIREGINWISELEYSLEVQSNKVILGDRSEPKGINVGQFINDGAALILRELDLKKPYKLNDPLIERAMKDYKKKSREAENVWFSDNAVLHKNGVVLYATKDIAAGSELYMSYRVRYWLAHNLFSESTAFETLFSLLWLGYLEELDQKTFLLYGKKQTASYILKYIGLEVPVEESDAKEKLHAFIAKSL